MCHSGGCPAAGGGDMAMTMGDTMWRQMRGAGWERWRTGNLPTAPAPAIPKGLPARVANVELHVGDATSGRAFTLPLHAMPLFPLCAAEGKLPRCVSFIQLISKCHFSTETPRFWKSIVSSACKRPQVRVPLREDEELLVKQKYPSIRSVFRSPGESKKHGGKEKEESNSTEGRSSCTVMNRTEGNTRARCLDWADQSPKLRVNSWTDGLCQLKWMSTLCS